MRKDKDKRDKDWRKRKDKERWKQVEMYRDKMLRWVLMHFQIKLRWQIVKYTL